MIRKTLFAAALAALMSTPAWAIADPSSTGVAHGHAPSTTPVGAPGNHPGEPGERGQGKGPSDNHGQSGNSHRCRPVHVGFIVSGTLVSQKLTANSDGTYTGEITVKVTHTNHHAVTEKEKEVTTTERTYSLTSAHVTFGLTDANSDGTVGLDDLIEGDRVMLVGKVTKLANKHCDRSKFTSEKTIRRLIFSAPEPAPAA
jgi:hypothetical protein